MAVFGFCALLAACATRVEPEPEPPQQASQDELDDIMGLPPLSDEEAVALPGQAWRQHSDLRVGLLLPLSGQHAAVGESMLHAAEMALFDVAGDNFTLVVRDTRGTPEGAAEAAEAALRDGASLLLGPLFGDSAEAAAPVAAEERVSLIAFTNSRSVAQPGVYVMGLLPSAQVERVVDYATRQGLQRFAALAPGNEYGDTVIATYQQTVPASGGEIVRIVTYPAGQTQVGEQVKVLGDYQERRRALQRQRAELKARNDEAAKLALKRLENLDTLGDPEFEAVLLPQGGQDLRAIAPLLPYYDIDPETVQFLGTAQWNDPALGREPALIGGWFAAPPPEPWREFSRRYRELYGANPPQVAGLAYDATALAAVLTRDADPAIGPQNFVVQRLAQPSGFAGLNGIFRFSPDGTVERGLAILEMQKDGIVVREPAPQSFQIF
jgi:ABC-type branched-subunit amino acid transport system substrate-binding protein